jgi:hypothetical protein
MDAQNNQVQDGTLINDIRSSADFRGITFSGYKKADVKKQLLLHLSNGRIEPSCYWSAEMVCASHFMEFVSNFRHRVLRNAIIYCTLPFQLLPNHLSAIRK